jgi:hypothetical protein
VSASITVQFTDGAQFTVSEPPIRVEADGTVVAAVPLYFNPATGQTSSGQVSVTVQENGNTSPPVSLTIEDLPPVASYGVQPGQLTHAFVVFDALVIGENLNILMAAQPLIPPNSALQQAQSGLTGLLPVTIKAREEIDGIAANSSTVANVGTLSDGTPIQFNSSSLDSFDRIVGVWMISQFASQFPAGEDAAAVVAAMLPQLTSASSVEAVVGTIQESNNFDPTLAILQGLQDYNVGVGGAESPALRLRSNQVASGDVGASGGVLGKLLGYLNFGTTMSHVFNNISEAVSCGGYGISICVQEINGELSGTGRQLVTSWVANIFGTGWLGKILGSALNLADGVGGMLGDIYGLGATGAELIDQNTSSLYTSGQLESAQFGQINVSFTSAPPPTSPPQDSTNFCCFDDLPVAGICDLSNNCVALAPIGAPNTNYSDITASVVDSTTNITLATETVDLSDLSPTATVTVPTLSPSSPSSEGLSPATLPLGPVGGCQGGQLSGTLQVSAPAGVSWDAFAGLNEFVGQTSTVSPTSGIGPGTITVTITMAPQTPGPQSTCQSTMAEAGDLPVWVVFLDTGNSPTTDVTFTFIFVDTE